MFGTRNRPILSDSRTKKVTTTCSLQPVSPCPRIFAAVAEHQSSSDMLASPGASETRFREGAPIPPRAGARHFPPPAQTAGIATLPWPRVIPPRHGVYPAPYIHETQNKHEMLPSITKKIRISARRSLGKIRMVIPRLPGAIRVASQ